ncbi:hypothetical protein F0562_013676 [Nyssa sinensis]|uniref:Chromo domain-containing protein n=1 Tax=Nyssa sinensis TaxID=561372 RepID=A0A5J4ZNA4_9ASTE|nr:hypothetical protein F0562_013676 [Nyssa sinensis]
MGTNKERIEHLEFGLGAVQEGLQRMEFGMNDKLHHLEEPLNRLLNVLLSNPKSSNHGNHHRENQDGGRQIVSSKSAKLKFPRFSGEDPTEWFNRWLRRTLQEEGHMISWEKFEEELWAHFGPSGCEDFDEALSRIRQLGTLRDYQREFEKLGNKVRGWTQRALVGTFMGGFSFINEVDEQLITRDAILRQLKSNLEASITCMKQTADQKRRDVTFKVGDIVFLKLHPYRQQSVFKHAHQKLASRFYGPYPVLQKIGAVAYKLQLLTGARIHPVFHISLLKKFIGEHTLSSTELPPVTNEGAIVLEPQHILDTRWIKKGKKFEEEHLLQWKHFPTEEATWETHQSLLAQFPDVDLTNKSPPGGGSIDKP